MTKRLWMVCLLLLTAGAAWEAQAGEAAPNERREERVRARKERKEQQREAEKAAWERAVLALRDSAFVVEIDQIIFKRGRSTFVSSQTNFVSMQGGEATVQVAFNVPWSGWNGLGGITVDGRVTSRELIEDGKGNQTLTINVSGIGISAQVLLYLPRDTDQASVTVTPNLHSQRLQMRGQLVPLAESSVFKGSSL